MGSAYTGQDLGVLTHARSDQFQDGTAAGTTNTDYSYVWWSGAKTSSVTSAGQMTGTSNSSYDADGFLYKLEDTAVSRKIFYQTDMMGQLQRH